MYLYRISIAFLLYLNLIVCSCLISDHIHTWHSHTPQPTGSDIHINCRILLLLWALWALGSAFHPKKGKNYTHYHLVRVSVGISCMVQYGGRHTKSICSTTTEDIALSAWQHCHIRHRHFTGGVLLTVLHCALCNALVVQLCREQFPIALCLRQNALSVSALLLCVVDIETCRHSTHAAGGFMDADCGFREGWVFRRNATT